MGQNFPHLRFPPPQPGTHEAGMLKLNGPSDESEQPEAHKIIAGQRIFS